MKPFRAMQFFLPGIFLLVLGIGNIAVGAYKGAQYRQVVEELNSLEPKASGLVNASPLQRIQLIQENADRVYHRQQKAQARQNFYGLVIIGGKIFLCFSAIFLGLALAIHSRGELPPETEEVSRKALSKKPIA